jgi:beta-glucosidase
MLAVASAMLWSTHAFASSSTRERALLQGLLARMTLEEKLGQLNQLDGRSNPAAPEVSRLDEGAIRGGRVGSFLGVYGAAKTRRLQRIAVDESRLGTAVYWCEQDSTSLGTGLRATLSR